MDQETKTVPNANISPTELRDEDISSEYRAPIPVSEKPTIISALSSYRDRIDTMKSEGKVTKPRLLLFGSFVHKLGEFSDIDLLLLFDSATAPIPSDGEIADLDAVKPDGELLSGIELCSMNTQNFLDQLHETDMESNRNILAVQFLPRLVELRLLKELTESQFEFAYSLPIFMDATRGQFTRFSQERMLKEFGIETPLKEGDSVNAEFIANLLKKLIAKFQQTRPELSECFEQLTALTSNEKGFGQEEAMILTNNTIAKFQENLPVKAKKVIGGFATQFSHGKNNVQMWKVDGLRLIYGENITDDKGANVFNNEELSPDFLTKNE